MPIEPLLWMFAGVCFFSLGLLVGYGMCEDKQNRRKENRMTYLDLLRDADRQLDDGRITIGEYEQMIKPLECEVQPEVVRCGECKHNGTHNCLLNLWATIFNSKPKDDFFCGMAERRTE